MNEHEWMNMNEWTWMNEHERTEWNPNNWIPNVGIQLPLYIVAGSTKDNGREPKTGLGWVFNYKLGCYDDVHVIMYTDAHPYL